MAPSIKSGVTLGVAMNSGRPQLSDEELALALKQGDETAFRDLFERHSRAIVACMFRPALPAAEAEDLAQEVFLRVFRAIKLFEPARGSFKAWLFAIARNVAIDTMRRRSTSSVKRGASEALVGAKSPPECAARCFARAIVQCLESRAAARLSGIITRIRGCAPTGFLPQQASWFVHRCDHPPKKLTGFFSLISFRDGVFQASL